MAGNWTKLTVTTDTEHLELVSAIMSMLSNGLMIEDYSDFSLEGMYGSLVDESLLRADRNTARVSLFVPEEKNLAEYRAFLEERFAYAGLSLKTELSGMSEEDFAESWKKYYQPIPLGGITIVPAWMEYAAKEGEIPIFMDPGMAFGTGSHETTRLAIRLLEGAIAGGERLLDVGCGSGILSICAKELGAKECFACDIDPVAVRVARENVKNGGYAGIRVEESDLLAGVDLSGGKYTFCAANIVADVILRMLPELKKYLEDGAPVILSGIISARADEIRKAAADAGFTVARELTENDWIGFLLR